jgi:hypothetical protein
VSANGGSDFSASGVPFRYLPAPTIKRVTTRRRARRRYARARRGARLRRHGRRHALPRRGDRRRRTVALRDRARVRCAAAARQDGRDDDDTDASGVVAVIALEVLHNGSAQFTTASGISFAYFAHADVDSVEPLAAPARVTVLGRGFATLSLIGVSDETAVEVDGLLGERLSCESGTTGVAAALMSDTELVCVAPASTAAVRRRGGRVVRRCCRPVRRGDRRRLCARLCGLRLRADVRRRRPTPLVSTRSRPRSAARAAARAPARAAAHTVLVAACAAAHTVLVNRAGFGAAAPVEPARLLCRFGAAPQAATRLADDALECASPAAAAAAADAVEPEGAVEGGDARRLLGAVALEVNGGADWVAGAIDGASIRSRRSHSARAWRAAARSSLDDDGEEPNRGVRPGAVAFAVSFNGGADFDGGDNSGVPGALVFEYVASIAVSSLAPRAGPTSAGTALRVFGEASRSRPSSRACSGAARAATPLRRPSCARPTSAFSCARALGGGDDVAHAGVIALELCTCGASLNLMCCFMRVGEFGTALNPISKQSRVMCDRLWALNTRQVLTAAQRQLAHDASLVLCHAARRTWLSGAGRALALTLALACFPCWLRS